MEIPPGHRVAIFVKSKNGTRTWSQESWRGWTQAPGLGGWIDGCCKLPVTFCSLPDDGDDLGSIL
jgi:hypothetical protein